MRRGGMLAEVAEVRTVIDQYNSSHGRSSPVSLTQQNRTSQNYCTLGEIYLIFLSFSNYFVNKNAQFFSYNIGFYIKMIIFFYLRQYNFMYLS